MPIARAGWPFILPVAAAGLLAAVAGWWWAAAALAVAAGYLAFFFRDPERTPPSGDGLLLAPGDGRLMRTVRHEDGRSEIHIFLGLLDVHVNRAPCDGVIRSVELSGDSHLLAWKDEAATRNVQNRIVIETRAGLIEMKQIVGFAARRLELWKKPGEALRAGERIGIMKFGSRIDLVLPAQVEVTAASGIAVKAGVTVLGRLRAPGAGQGSAP